MKIAKIVFIVISILSLLINIIFVIAINRTSGGFINYVNDKGMQSAGAIVSVPQGASIGFGTIMITIEEGDSAYLQFSVKTDEAQSNWDIAYLYDPNVIELKTTAYGIKVTGIEEGECVLQSFDAGGINDIAIIRVIETEMEMLK